MTAMPGTVRPILGPLPCIACGRMVTWATFTAVIEERAGWRSTVSHIRTRALLDKSTDMPHQCRAQARVAA